MFAIPDIDTTVHASLFEPRTFADVPDRPE
jgi:hypothetical protein